ncbi:hypothetical protein quinque_005430 [Culex quinquefasciatus]
MSLLPRSIAVQPPSAIANFRPIVPTEPLGVRTLRVQAGADASVRRKPPDTRGIPRAVPSTAEHDRSRTRIARDTVPVLASSYINRRRKPGRPVDSSTEVPESVTIFGSVEAGGAEEGRVREQQLTAHSGRRTREEDVSRPDAIPEESRPTIWRSGRKQEEPALICGHPGKCRCFPDLSPSNLPPPSLISVPLCPQNPSVFVRFAYRPAQTHPSAVSHPTLAVFPAQYPVPPSTIAHARGSPATPFRCGNRPRDAAILVCGPTVAR